MIDLELQRKSLPNEPGVYFFKDKNGKIIYIGKAINLRKRVSQYFLKSSYNDPYYEDKIKELVKQINSMEYIVTENEKEAFILENIQIKKYLPPFNIRMRDSKTYPWLCFFYMEEFPRIKIIRNPEKFSNKNVFIGPYTDKKEIQRILRDLRKIFPYCSCNKKVKKSTRTCIYYQLKLCPGPCIGAVSREAYLGNVKKIELFLKGETDELKSQIKGKMKNAADDQDYERAAFWRDKLEAIEHSTSNQSVLFAQEENKDIIGYYNDKKEEYATLVIIHIRKGRISNKSSYKFDLREKLVKKDKILTSILEQYYQEEKQSLPEQIIVPEFYKEFKLLREVLKDSKDTIDIRTPKDENEGGMLRIANKNAKVMVNQAIQMEGMIAKDDKQIQIALEEAVEIFDLPKIPRIIEGFDISNTDGTDPTGSMVYFLEGKPYNKYYRHFNVRSKSTPDDVGMMKEVLGRRYSMLLERNWTLPDLILVDGGKGQLNAGVSVLKDLGLEIPIIGLAKRIEEIFIPDRSKSILLPRNSQLLKILQRVRDEAHRFAVKLHKKQRQKRLIGSILDDIKGIGPATRNKLLKHFGSVENVKKASKDELIQVIGNKLAEIIMRDLKG